MDIHCFQTWHYLRQYEEHLKDIQACLLDKFLEAWRHECILRCYSFAALSSTLYQPASLSQWRGFMVCCLTFWWIFVLCYGITGCCPSCYQNNYGYLQEILTRWALLIFSSGRWGAFNGLMRHRDEHRGSQGNAHTHEPSPSLLNGKLLSGGAGPINLSQTLGHWTRLGQNHFVSVISGLCRASHTTHGDLWGCNYK